LLGGLLCVQLAVMAIHKPWKSDGQVRSMSIAADPLPALDPDAPMQLDIVPLESLEDTRTRPLFAENRRPETEEESATVATGAPETAAIRAGISLSAIVITGAQRMALIRVSPEAGLLQVREGDSVGGWSLDRINAESVELSNAKGQTEIALRHYDPPPEPKPAAAPRAQRPKAPAPPRPAAAKKP
jgi:general secretion pathway protein N